MDVDMDMLLIVVVVIVLFFILFSNRRCKKRDKRCYSEGYGSVINKQPSQFILPLGALKAHYLNNRGVISVENLDVVLQKIQNGESFGIMTEGNNVANRKGAENAKQMLKQIVPFSDPKLEARGLKIAKNPFDNSDILIPYSGPQDDYPYPKGFWLRVVNKNSIY